MRSNMYIIYTVSVTESGSSGRQKQRTFQSMKAGSVTVLKSVLTQLTQSRRNKTTAVTTTTHTHKQYNSNNNNKKQQANKPVSYTHLRFLLAVVSVINSARLVG